MRIKKILAFVVSAACFITCLTGCDSKGKVQNGDVKEISAFMFFTPTPYSEDLPIWKEAEKRTGIRIKSVVSKVASDENTAYSTMLAGNELPDIIRINRTKLAKLANDGALIPLDDLIEKYAPNIKNLFEKSPVAKRMATMEDGHIYFIPGSLSGIDIDALPSEGFFIRQDWLDKLGLKVPTTIEEYHDVLYAFATKDPNGNGLKDEIPYFARGHNLTGLLQLFCATTGYRVGEDGKYYYSPITEEYKTAMKTLAQWYKEGLIDKELYSRSSVREQLLGQNLGGSTVDWFSSTSKFNESVKNAVPDINFVAMLPPVNIKGKVESILSRSPFHNWAWGISADADKDDIVDIVKYFDFWMSEEGCKLRSYGIEGVSYNLDSNGNIVWSEEALSYADGVPNYMRSLGSAEIGSIGTIESEKSAMNEIGIKGFELYEDIILPQEEKLVYTKSEQDVIDAYANNIDTLRAEQEQKWIFGSEDVEATWDKYVKSIKDMGIDKVLEAYNSAYARAINN